MVEKYLSPDNAKVVLHWFTGSSSEAQRAINLGCYFSVNAQMAANARTAKIVAALPCDRILTETDGPFAHTGGQPSRPINVANSLEAIAATRGDTVAEVEDFVRQNFAAVTSIC
jgi:TatD DNase family protein